MRTSPERFARQHMIKAAASTPRRPWMSSSSPRRATEVVVATILISPHAFGYEPDSARAGVPVDGRLAPVGGHRGAAPRVTATPDRDWASASRPDVLRAAAHRDSRRDQAPVFRDRDGAVSGTREWGSPSMYTSAGMPAARTRSAYPRMRCGVAGRNAVSGGCRRSV